jgi:hypothetical protein
MHQVREQAAKGLALAKLGDKIAICHRENVSGVVARKNYTQNLLRKR